MDKITVKQAVRELDCWPSDIYTWIKDGKLNSEKENTGRDIFKDAKYEALKKERGVK